MPLSEFVRYINAQLPFPKTASRFTTPFAAEGGHVFVHYANLRLESNFSPIVDTADGRLRGHVATLTATHKTTHQRLEADAVLRLPGDDEEFIFLDRLVRTLHTLNYLTYPERHSGGLLLLKVHPRHVASIAADHGLAFEEILRACGLLPEQITLELEIDGVEDHDHLARAIANYKSRGYRIAISNFGKPDKRDPDAQLLQAIRPAIVRLDPRLLAQAEPISGLIELLHESAALIMIEGVNTQTQRSDARENGFDLLQVTTSTSSDSVREAA
jgi:EAL domain-containing protein (putative c-di-GMP-specific phosphodiesterase class I)